MAKVQGEVGGQGSERRVTKVQGEIGGQGSGGCEWPRFRGRRVAKVQGEVGGQGFRAMAKVPSFCNQTSLSRFKGKEVANIT